MADYIRFDIHNPPVGGSKSVNFASCVMQAMPVMCGPKGLPGKRNHLFHNNGGTERLVAQLSLHEQGRRRL